jgi:hypothetical protein
MNSLLIAVARAFIPAVAAIATRATSRAYSIKSYPSSSDHSLLIIAFMLSSLSIFRRLAGLGDNWVDFG